VSAKLVTVKEGKEYQVTIRPTDTTAPMITAVEVLTDVKAPDLRKRMWLFVLVTEASATQPTAPKDGEGSVIRASP